MSSIIAEPLSAICTDRVRWLWEPYLPRGKLAILDGDPGVGKSLLTVDIAARLSRGGPMPNGVTLDRPHVTLLLSGEDRAQDTIAPRTAAAQADLTRIYVLASTDGAQMSFPADLGTLEEEMRERRADLVVIDPIMAFLPPEVAANNDQSVRGALNLFAALAAPLRLHNPPGPASPQGRREQSPPPRAGQHRDYRRRTGRSSGRSSSNGPGPSRGRAHQVQPRTVPTRTWAFGSKSDAHRRALVEWTGALNIGADYLDLPGPSSLQPRDVAVNWLVDQLAARAATGGGTLPGGCGSAQSRSGRFAARRSISGVSGPARRPAGRPARLVLVRPECGVAQELRRSRGPTTCQRHSSRLNKAVLERFLNKPAAQARADALPCLHCGLVWFRYARD